MPTKPPNFRPARKRKPDKHRATSSQRGYNQRWRRARKRFLAEHPLCCQCLANGRSVVATDVDHIQAVAGPLDPLFWDSSNWQALCHGCHSRKTVAEDGGFGRSS